MKNVLAALCVVGLVASVASAQVFPTTRDSFILGHSSEMNIGGGLVTSQRMAKAGNQHFQVFDFDFAGLNAYIAANPTVPVRFNAYYTGGGADAQQIQVRAFNAVNDWTEGDQTAAWTNFGWTMGTKQVLRHYAGGVWHVNDNGTPTSTGDDFQEIDAAASDLWNPADSNEWLEDLAYTQNGADLTIVDASVAGFLSVELDAAFLTALQDGDLKGIYVTTDSWANASGRSREYGSVAAFAAFIEVPEPFSMTLLGLGGLGLLIRRKRR